MRSWKPVIVSRFRTRLIRIADGDVSRSSSEGGRRPPGGSIIPFPLLFQGHLNRANQIKVAMVVPFSLFLLLLLSFPLSFSLSLSLTLSTNSSYGMEPRPPSYRSGLKTSSAVHKSHLLICANLSSSGLHFICPPIQITIRLSGEI